MKTIAMFAALTLAAAPVSLFAAEAAPPQPDATATPCPAMPHNPMGQHQMGAMQGRVKGGGAMQGQMPMQGQMHGQMHGQMNGQQMQGHQMQGQKMQGMPMQGGMSGNGHGAMMGQGQAAMAGHMGMSGGMMPCQASPTPQPEAKPKGN